ncbi:MAG: ATP-binding protein [Actinomycetota bacterium]
MDELSPQMEAGRRDVVDRAESTLREGLGTFVRFLDDLPVAVFALDASGRPFYANRASRKLLGKGIEPDATPDQMAATYRVYVGGTDELYPVERMPIIRALAGRSSTADDIELRLPHGTVSVQVSASPILDEQGNVIYAIAAFQDITERKRLEEDRRRLDTAKTRFIADAAHELRTPLSTVAGFVDLLTHRRHEMTEAEVQELFGYLHGSTERIKNLVAHLLDFSRLEREGALELHPVALAEAVGRALEIAPPPAGVAVDDVVPAALVAHADQAHLDQVLVNLLTNAYRYGGSSVRVEAERVGAAVWLSVSDDGRGVPEELLPQLFEPFTRGANAGALPGSGLGLAITKRIIDALGGEIRYEHNRPHGARFIVRLAG